MPDIDPERTPSLLYEFLEGWGNDNIGSGMPSPKTLREISGLVHAVGEFLLEPIGNELVTITKECATGAVDFDAIGRLMVWTDQLRDSLEHLHTRVGDIVLLTHDGLPEIAQGYPTGSFGSGTILDHPEYAAEMRRLHGLDRS